jgi:hypothetical protein
VRLVDEMLLGPVRQVFRFILNETLFCAPQQDEFSSKFGGESSSFDATHHHVCIIFLNALFARNFEALSLIYRNK